MVSQGMKSQKQSPVPRITRDTSARPICWDRWNRCTDFFPVSFENRWDALFTPRSFTVIFSMNSAKACLLDEKRVGRI